MPLSQHVQPDTSDARQARVWSRVKAGLELAPPRHRSALWAAGAFATVAIGALAVLVASRAAPAGSALENAALETAGDRLGVTLLDGSQVTLDSKTRVQVAGGTAQAVALTLQHGRISCDVVHRPGRSFVVRASGVQVRVVGTRFSVSDEVRVDGASVLVSVERGAVEVESQRHPGQLTRVAAGQTFSEWVPVAPPSALPSGSAAEPPAPAQGSPVPSVATPSASESAGAAPSEPTRSDTPGAQAIGARELLDAANTARRAGDARAAASAYAQLLRNFPSDGRAGLAAFELGRLRMDRLNDLAGAVQALERAVQLAPGLREDALARLVTAYAASGRSADCRRSQAAYQAAFPGGVHRDAVARGCHAP